MARELQRGAGDGEYLEAVSGALQQAFDQFSPDLVIYNAGTDILAGGWGGVAGVQGRQPAGQEVVRSRAQRYGRLLAAALPAFPPIECTSQRTPSPSAHWQATRWAGCGSARRRWCGATRWCGRRRWTTGVLGLEQQACKQAQHAVVVGGVSWTAGRASVQASADDESACLSTFCAAAPQVQGAHPASAERRVHAGEHALHRRLHHRAF